ncbi:hypothetical protein [uncultured Corynebacterium sp.]|uniref:hypothetical protein n=1 Tax=uncultured Corynebacterium sp. TaxID=159447 RepID=UPI00288B6680|nr:hypothetical protein [uncultured Corynebacterium sp.]
MNQSKNSPRREDGNKTVPGGQEQSSRAGSWWALAFIILCTITIILDRRKPPLFVGSTEIQDNQSKRGQVESSTSDDRQRRNKWNPQTLGNFSLVLIQGSLFSLFQIVASGASLEAWTMCLCFPIMLLGFIIFFLARRGSAAEGVVTGLVLLLLTVGGIISSVGGAPNAVIIFFQISILVVAWRASESLKGPSQKWLE